MPLGDVGWDLGACPNADGAACTNMIANCGDVATCLTCIDEAAVDRVIDIAYAAFIPTDPRNPLEKAINKCQTRIVAAVTTSLAAKSIALARCWNAVNTGQATGACATGDDEVASPMAKAEARMLVAVCKACGGTDRECGGADDLTPPHIGFAPICSDVSPFGATSCAGAIATLGDVVACVDCVTDYAVDCAARAAVPGLVAYPQECRP